MIQIEEKGVILENTETGERLTLGQIRITKTKHPKLTGFEKWTPKELKK